MSLAPDGIAPMRASAEAKDGISCRGTSPPSARYSLPKFQASSSAQQSAEKAP